MPFIAILIFVVGVVVELLIATVSSLVLSSILHGMWWEAIPALGVSEAFLIGILFLAVSYATGVTTPKLEKFGAIYRIVTGLIFLPFLLSWVIGELNNNLIPVFPDISYGATFTFTLVALGFALITGLIADFLEKVLAGITK